ncbi:hypothetical protein V7x_16420 [Crateriforma conspicua]|uniref:Uncharacterized protein n=1 Tax=Crateriforma conspicua TaxID=2527996 RepID=A0A5C6FWP7_9PLAN|nr:hypothetical protein [Crateriforma conspicua]TWU66085.1 hypothetical protein V7x_16420 [Crateriforma conspicua]
MAIHIRSILILLSLCCVATADEPQKESKRSERANAVSATRIDSTVRQIKRSWSWSGPARQIHPSRTMWSNLWDNLLSVPDVLRTAHPELEDGAGMLVTSDVTLKYGKVNFAAGEIILQIDEIRLTKKEELPMRINTARVALVLMPDGEVVERDIPAWRLPIRPHPPMPKR